MQWYLFSSNILLANIDDNFLGILALPDFSVGSSLRLYHKSDSIFTVPLLGKRSSNASSLTFSDIASFRCVLDALMRFILFYFYYFFNLFVVLRSCSPLNIFLIQIIQQYLAMSGAVTACFIKIWNYYQKDNISNINQTTLRITTKH